MLLLAVLPALALAVQQPTTMPPSPVKRIEVQPSTRTITAGDSVQLTVRALGADGKPIPNAVLWVQLLGGGGQGTVRPESFWLVASSVGKFPLGLSAVVPGSRPFVDSTSVEFEAVPGPAVRMELGPAAVTIVDGQSLRLSAIPYSKGNDRTTDPIKWRSSRSEGRIGGRGRRHHRSRERPWSRHRLGSRRVGRGGRARAAGQHLQAHTQPSQARRAPGRRRRVRGGRQGCARASRSPGSRPPGASAPGDGQLGADGRFVAYRPGAYTVTATLGRRAASTTVHGARARRAPLGDGRGPPAAHRLPDLGGVDPPQRQGRLPRHPRRRATGCMRWTSATRASPWWSTRFRRIPGW